MVARVIASVASQVGSVMVLVRLTPRARFPWPAGGQLHLAQVFCFGGRSFLFGPPFVVTQGHTILKHGSKNANIISRSPVHRKMRQQKRNALHEIPASAGHAFKREWGRREIFRCAESKMETGAHDMLRNVGSVR